MGQENNGEKTKERMMRIEEKWCFYNRELIESNVTERLKKLRLRQHSGEISPGQFLYHYRVRDQTIDA